ncbi:MAG TPA: hypothetical protein VN253_20990, partial [Kofleriaceae bacterium]|nr:hypothetical protein [Kofleriaceae bacterium]
MQLSSRLERLLPVLGVDAGDLPREVLVAAPFAQMAPDTGALARWLGGRCAGRPEVALPALCARPFDPLAARLLDEALRALARVDAALAARHAAAVP